jgi:hypothetical protein
MCARTGTMRLLVIANMGERTVRDFGLDMGGFEPGGRVSAEVIAGSARPRVGRADEAGNAEDWQPVSRVRGRDVVVLRIER